MTTLESILLISLAIVIMLFQNLFFGIFNIYVIKEHDTTLQRLLNILYFLLAIVIQVSWLFKDFRQDHTNLDKMALYCFQIGSLLNIMIIYMGLTETEFPKFLLVLENVRSVQILCSLLLAAIIGKSQNVQMYKISINIFQESVTF